MGWIACPLAASTWIDWAGTMDSLQRMQRLLPGTSLAGCTLTDPPITRLRAASVVVRSAASSQPSSRRSRMVTTPGLVMPGSALPCVLGMLPCKATTCIALNRCRCNAYCHTSLMGNGLTFRQVRVGTMHCDVANVARPCRLPCLAGLRLFSGD